MEFALIGILLILIGIILLARRAKGGALILIGPIPIILGNSRIVLNFLFILALIFLLMWWLL